MEVLMPTKKIPLLVKTVQLPDPPAPKAKQRKEKRSKKTHARIHQDIREASSQISDNTRLPTGLLRRVQETISLAYSIEGMLSIWDQLRQNDKDGIRNQIRRLRRLVDSITSGERERRRRTRGRYQRHPIQTRASMAETVQRFEEHLRRR